jgi:predicted  nucleic acid-binding Zn ribbon protein
MDPYEALRPEAATPVNELCTCDGRPPIVLQDHLSRNPMSCLKCNLEIPPERLGISSELARGIANWRNLYRAFDVLWLDSGDYEDWAREQLEDPNGRVVVMGLELVDKLNQYVRAYYWWFEDASEDDFVPLSQCPRCDGSLDKRFDCFVCEKCSIMVHKE